jgi:dihydroflavonol-4-reductase
MQDETLLVTGASGLVGSNLCLLAVRAGYRVRGMVRSPNDAEPLSAHAIEPVIADIRDLDSVLRAADSVGGILHTAAVLGGTWSKATVQEFWDANYTGTVNVMEAARRTGVRRVVDLDTLALLDWSQTITERSAIVAIQPGDSGYVASKRASYYEGMHRASRGQDIVFVTPGAIYGPSLFVERALHATSFTGTLCSALNGKLESYVPIPLLWAFAEDVAATALAAWERGATGSRYLACGRVEDLRSLAAFCNLGAEIAGIRHRVREVDLSSGGTQIGSMAAFAKRQYADPVMDSSRTETLLGVQPRALRDGLETTVEWLRANGKL